MISECVKSKFKITAQSYEIVTIFLFFVEEIIDLYPRLTIVNHSTRSNDRYKSFWTQRYSFFDSKQIWFIFCC